MSITADNNSTFLEVDNAHLRVSGDIHATSVKVGAIEILPGYSLESTTVIGNTTSQTIQFTNTETSLVTSGDINMLHSSNNAAIKLNSNVVAEFPRSKKLIKYPRVALTQNALNNGYAAEASTENDGTSTGQAYRLFDGIAGGERGYHSAITYSSGSNYTGSASITDAYGNQHQGEWIKLQMPTTEKMKLSGFSFSPRYTSGSEYHHRAPYKGVFLGSTDGTNWYPIHYFDNVTVPELTTVSRTFENNTNDYYNHIALVAYEVGPNVGHGNVLNFAEMELFGIPEYDPDADGVDVKVTSYPNVPNTDWLEVYYDAKDLVDGAVTSVDDLTPSGTNDGTATNVTVSDGAFMFDGSGDYIESLNITSLSGNQVLSTSVWVKFTSWTNTNVDMVFSLGDRTVSGNGKEYALAAYHSGANAPTNGLYVSIYGYNAIKSQIIPDLNKWYHFVTTHDGSNHQIFINGVLVTSSASNGNVSLPTTGCDLVLGGDTSASRSQFMNGSIANFRLFNRALTQDEVWQLYAYQKEYFGHGDLSMTLKAGRLGIGTSEPRAALDVRGAIRATDVPVFSARNAVVGIYTWDATNNGTPMNFTTVDVNHNNCYDGTSAFTAPRDGIYSFTVIKNLNMAGTYQLLRAPYVEFLKNGLRHQSTTLISASTGSGIGSGSYAHTSATASRIMSLAAGDKVQVAFTYDNSPSTQYEYGIDYFSGYLITYT
jgi:hypothetical protein